jgi:hypothetical protein
VNVTFACPVCDRPDRIEVPASTWQCSGCGHRLELTAPGEGLSACAICGNAELYKKKDFPHWLGLTILSAACLGFVICNAIYEPWWAWAILIGSALFDGLLYLRVGDAVVCYRCNAHYRRLAAAEHKPFELVVAERYRQERLRREELEKNRP